jgi:hypothetical protein
MVYREEDEPEEDEWDQLFRNSRVDWYCVSLKWHSPEQQEAIATHDGSNHRLRDVEKDPRERLAPNHKLAEDLRDTD